ncbi:MAG TPA: DUF4349 domain-containing protein [Gemmatimonadaceae bacterium]|nr:DUF4349 domain-containing protein [Gemmatimonadaceae bacterium]
MKALTLFLIAAFTLSACKDESQSKGDGSSVATDMAATSPAPAPPVEPGFGIVGAAAGNQSAEERGASLSREARPQAPPSAADPLQNFNIGTTAPSMVIRTGQAFIEVEKVDPAVLKIRQLAVQFGGYIANSSMSGGRDQIRQATFELKIPAARYEEAVNSLSTIGKVETVSSNAQDVGEEFVDVTARVNNARRLEERLISLLANRTGKLDEVLRVERELARVREEIERYEGRLRFLTTRVATSTLTITVHEPAPILGNNPGENPIAAALRRAWRNFVALLAGGIASLGVLIPLALVGYAGWYGYRRWRRK